MIFAVEEINDSSTLLPNVELGYAIYDTCMTHMNSLRAAMALVSGEKETVLSSSCGKSPQVPVIIGDAQSTASIQIARTLGVFYVPMVSYFSSCACLSDKNEFPSFFRTIPSDNFQARAIARFLKLFAWTWVGLISGDDDYGKSGIQIFMEEIQNFEICISFFEIIPKVYSEEKILKIVDTIKKSTAKVIVTFAIEGDMYTVLTEVAHQNITDKQWIATEAWITSSLASSMENFDSLGGTLGFAIHRTDIRGLKEFLCRLHPSLNLEDPFINEFWQGTFGCAPEIFRNKTASPGTLLTKPPCTGSENLENISNTYNDVSQLRVTSNVYKAVYAIAHALDNLYSCQNGKGPFKNGTCAKLRELEPWQLIYYLKEVRFETPAGEEMYFDENGDPVASYDIINWQRGTNGITEFVKIGQFEASESSEKEFVIDKEKIVWSGNQKKVPESVCSKSCPPGTRKASQEGKPVCCFDCVPCAAGEISNHTDSTECMKCPLGYWSNLHRNTCISTIVEYLSYKDTLGIIFVIVSVLGASVTITVMVIFYLHKDTPIVKANNSELSFLILMSLIPCFVCSLAFIGQPSVWSCMLRHTVFGISFALCISCVLGKTIVVLMAFQATLPGNNVMRYFGPLQQRGSIFICTLVQVIICLLWLTLSPPFPVKNTKYQSVKIILECNLGSKLAFSGLLGYIGFLACMCFAFAFLARKLPDNFNEAKFITFSMLIFCAVWITFIPAYISSPGKYTTAVEIFAILSSSFGLLTCIFLPKCYIILFKPEKNTKQHLMGKSIAKKL
ncbi:extracellular calcium-sensing receptor-like [Latimeria chalumnae]|uniref:extracellular calcium-sensing receptor-like n=1 Tax=Latimeria chalumnae TaxID=7897 RepID=UPI0003C10396|nr:PREDICTED: extracellular calcium-sensing receptor-like [Latimeria chalumnae]|eukprot:XP_006011735.1 PREDICTED: extracellular calcium-sensing receptor-like [Latimeria chalumnae]